MIDPASRPLQKRSTVRAAVDKKLGHGSGRSVSDAAEVLKPVERVEWLLAELITLMGDRAFHLWAQDYAHLPEPDCLHALAVIAEQARKVNPKVANVIRWTVDRGLQARDGSREEAAWDVVPEIWAAIWDEVTPFADATVARWPKALDPFTAPAPRAYVRKEVAPVKKGKRFPQVVLKPENAMRMGPAACYGLWKAGASDDELDAFFERTVEKDLADTLLKWVQVKGEPKAAALRDTLYPPHPLDVELRGSNIEMGYPGLAIFPADRLEPFTPRILENFRGIRMRPKPKRTFEQNVQALIDELGPNLVLMDAKDLTPDATPTVLELLADSVVVVVCGEGPRVAELERAARARDIPVYKAKK